MKNKIINIFKHVCLWGFIAFTIPATATMCFMIALHSGESHELYPNTIKFIDFTFANAVFFGMMRLLIFGIEFIIDKE